MGYWADISRRAFWTTAKAVKVDSGQAVMMLLAVQAIAGLIIWIATGEAGLQGNIAARIGSAAAPFLLAIPFYLWNLFREPARAAAEQAQQISGLQNQLAEEQASRPRLQARFETVSHGGTATPLDPAFANFGAVPSPLVAFLTITNIGSMPSIARDFRASLRMGDRQITLSVAHIGRAQMRAAGGGEITITGDDAIYNRASTPIPSGGMAQGFLGCFIPPQENVDTTGSPFTLTITFIDVLGTTYEVSHDSGPPLPFMPYVPFAEFSPRVPDSNS
jgi:hypothetical protein